MQRRNGYTIIELLVVIALLATLAAILFPVFAQVQGGARRSTCLSNLRQIGQSMAMYAQDYDGYFPYGADPVDKHTDAWGVNSKNDPILRDMPLLHDILLPYAKNREIWKCPSDTGLDVMRDQHGADGELARLDARPSVFGKFGSSYVWRTEFAFRRKLFQTSGYYGSREVGTAELAVVNDLTGEWHGGFEFADWSYNTLMGDGHVTHQTLETNRISWAISIDR